MTTTVLIKLMRPHQYIKNIFIFLPLFFALKITDTGLRLNAFIAFSLTASAISKSQAIVIMGVLATTGFALMVTLSLKAMSILSAYVLMSIAYSFYLKHIAILITKYSEVSGGSKIWSFLCQYLWTYRNESILKVD